MMDKYLVQVLELDGMEFHAYHGCLEEERCAGNTFVVDFKGQFPMEAAASSDRLEDSVDYSRIYDVIAAQMAVPSNLLENVAGRIVEAISEALPEIQHFTVRVSKKRPPVNGICEWSRVTLGK